MKNSKKAGKSKFWIYFGRNIAIALLSIFLSFLILVIACIWMIRSIYIQNVNIQTLNLGIPIEKVLVDIDNAYFKLVNNNYVTVIMKSDHHATDNKEYLNSLKKSQQAMIDIVNATSDIQSVYLVNFTSEMVISNLQNETIDLFFDSAWVAACPEDLDKATLITVESEGESYLSFLYPYRQYGNVTGVIAINTNREAMEYFRGDQFDACCLIDNSGNVIFSSGEEILLDFEKMEIFNARQSEVHSIWVGSKIYSIYTFVDRNYSLVLSVSPEMNNMSWIYLGMIVAYAVLAIAVVYKLSKRYAQYCYSNISAMTELLSDYYPESQALQCKDEFIYIKDNIAKLTTSNNMKEIVLSQKMLQLRNAQLYALQSQISPHFILNTLNMVNMLLMQTGDIHHPAIKINENMSKILAHVLASEKYIITIHEEIECTKDYISIEYLKKKKSFTVEWDVDDVCLQLKTVKFLLQPIVENSVRHGFSGCKKEDKRIRISIKREDDQVVFTVADNGNGMTEEKIQELRSEIKNKEFPAEKNIAVLNVHQRIRLVFGEEYGLEIVKSDEDGTIIQLTIPAEENIDELLC